MATEESEEPLKKANPVESKPKPLDGEFQLVRQVHPMAPPAEVTYVRERVLRELGEELAGLLLDGKIRTVRLLLETRVAGCYPMQGSYPFAPEVLVIGRVETKLVETFQVYQPPPMSALNYRRLTETATGELRNRLRKPLVVLKTFWAYVNGYET